MIFHRSAAAIVVLASGLPLSGQAFKQAPEAVALLESLQHTAPQQPSTPSFHLEATFHTFDAKGHSDGDGTVAEDLVQHGAWKRVTTFRGQRQTTYVANGKERYADDEDYLLSFAGNRVLKSLFDPVPTIDQFARDSLELRKVMSGTVPLNCVIVGLPYPNSSDSKATAPNAGYCSDQDGVLRVLQGRNKLIILFNNIVRLGPVAFARDIVMTEHGVTRATLHVDAIRLVPALTPQDVAAPGDLADSGAAAQVAGGVLSGKIVRKATPVYPQEAKDRGVQGTVILHALIGKDGTIRDLELVSAPDDSLVASAMDAVRQWLYTPYLLNGKPTYVDSTITVNYAFGR